MVFGRSSLDRELDRGVTTLQTQVRELAHDLAELKGETRAWQGAHTTTHIQEARDRVAGRRWIIGIAVAGAASMSTVIGLLIDIAAHVHK